MAAVSVHNAPPSPLMNRELPSRARFGLVGFSAMNRNFLNQVRHSSSCLEITLPCVTTKCLSFGKNGNLLSKIECDVPPRAIPARREGVREITRMKTISLASLILAPELYIDNESHESSLAEIGVLGSSCQLCIEGREEAFSCIKWECLTCTLCTCSPCCELTFCDRYTPRACFDLCSQFFNYFQPHM